MDGLITVRKAEIGTTIAPGTPIFQMVDLDRSGWPPGLTRPRWPNCGKASQPDQTALREDFQGQVVRLNQEGDTVTRELEVDVKFDKLPKPLVMGEEAEVDIDTGRQTAPGGAVIRRAYQERR